jgi:hypothetical protein
MKLMLSVRKYQAYLFSLGLLLFGFFSLGALYLYKPGLLSLFVVDATQSFVWYQWALNTAATFLLYVLGASAWIFPFVCFYAAYSVVYSTWYYEWDRLIAIGFFLISSCFLLVLMGGVVWRGALISGGILGVWFYEQFAFADEGVLFVSLAVLWVTSLVVITRLCFITPFIYIGAALFKEGGIGRSLFSYVYKCGASIGKIFQWLYGLFFGAQLENERELLLNDEQLEYVMALEEFVERESCEDGNADDVVENEVIAVKDESILLYALPDIKLFSPLRFNDHDAQAHEILKTQSSILEEKLARFGIEGKVIKIKRGPVVTCFEYQPQADMKLSKITALEDDLALALEATSLRILAPIPGTAVVGFEVSNKKRDNVLLSDIVRSDEYESFKGELPLVLGKDTVGRELIIDLVKMPHLLIAGSTGSGKSVALNVMLTTLLCRKTPDELKLILIDPKRLEFASYADVSHLLFPIVTMPKRAIQVLQWVVKTMEDRYEFLAKKGVRSINDYHMQFGKVAQKDMPYIVVVIDELADLMMTAGKQVEEWLARIAQMARAAGIHMIVATQRPSVDVITGLIKVNFPSRISFRVTSKVDSRTILDASGAEKLLGKGDMLFLDPRSSLLKRAHGAYVSDEEIKKIVEHVHGQRDVEYLQIDQLVKDSSSMRDEDDELFESVLGFLNEIDEVSISLLQRRFRIGYNRSARIIESLEVQGFIMASDGGKTRKVIRSE